MWLYLLVVHAWAEVPLPDYDRALAAAEWRALDKELDAACQVHPHAGLVCHAPERLDLVIARGQAWTQTVQPDAGISYLVGLAWRFKGDNQRARALWEKVTREDPDYATTWYDLGELYLSAGEWSNAEAAFEHVRRLTPEGAESWLADWRLAEVAAFQQDPAAFESHMRAALRQGFTFERVAGLPNWQQFLADPVMQASVEKLISVYGTREVLESLRPPDAPE